MSSHKWGHVSFVHCSFNTPNIGPSLAITKRYQDELVCAHSRVDPLVFIVPLLSRECFYLYKIVIPSAVYPHKNNALVTQSTLNYTPSHPITQPLSLISLSNPHNHNCSRQTLSSHSLHQIKYYDHPSHSHQ